MDFTGSINGSRSWSVFSSCICLIQCADFKLNSPRRSSFVTKASATLSLYPGGGGRSKLNNWLKIYSRLGKTEIYYSQSIKLESLNLLATQFNSKESVDPVVSGK